MGVNRRAPGVIVVVAGVSACAYDFDAHFTGSPAPEGFQGPAVLVMGDAEAGACPDGLAVLLDAHRDLVAPAGCTPCTCDAASVGCGAPTVTAFGEAGCTQAKESLPSAACSTLDSGGVKTASGVPMETTGNCEPSGGAPKPISWGETARLCGPCEGSCPGGADGTCVYRSGEAECSDPSFPVRKGIFYTGADDNRACTACTCGDPSCGGTTQLFAGDCSGTPVGALPHDGKCIDIDNLSVSMLRFEPGSEVLACAASGGTPSGAATATGPLTICCAAE